MRRAKPSTTVARRSGHSYRAPQRREVSEDSEPVPVIAAAPAATEAPTAPRLSIVVLPFVNLSDDPQQQYFADGITGDLITDLSRIPDMLVISRDHRLYLSR
jgi:adenylate cyclase